MKVIDVINHLKNEGYWVNFDKTRDIVLYGDTNKEITRIGVCWVATKRVIKEAQEKGINFIISHENIFYEATTSPTRQLLESAQEKKKMLDDGDITVYRCHDVWDMMPLYGVADTWAHDIGFEFEPRVVSSYNSYASLDNMTLLDVARKVADALKQYGEDGVTVYGDLKRTVHRLAIGTGAATNIFSMLKENPDVVVVSDDGVTNWIAVQWCIDNDLPLIIVNHPCSEIGGLKNMVNYFHKVMPDIDVTYLYEGYKSTIVLSDK